MGRRSLLVAAFALGFAACAVSDDGAPDPTDLEGADAWADASGGKADLPSSYGDLVAWVEDFYTNRMSAVWNNQEHPATAAAAKTRIRGLLAAGGIAHPEQVKFVTSVQRLRTELIDHSEIDIQLPGNVDKAKHVVRLVGDPKGAGVFLDKALFETTLQPPLCLTWDELNTAIDASYQPGYYAVDFVCHVVTEKVLRALGVGSARYSDQVRTYSLARWIWGPIFPSGNSSNPADWPESRSCK